MNRYNYYYRKRERLYAERGSCPKDIRYPRPISARLHQVEILAYGKMTMSNFSAAFWIRENLFTSLASLAAPSPELSTLTLLRKLKRCNLGGTWTLMHNHSVVLQSLRSGSAASCVIVSSMSVCKSLQTRCFSSLPRDSQHAHIRKVSEQRVMVKTAHRK